MHTQLENSPAHKGQSMKSNESNPPVSKPSQVLVKAQLEMTTPGDSAEREADAVADSIVTEGKIARSVSTGHSGGGIALPSQFSSRISSFQGQGSRIAGDLKTRMESGFGRDFSNVRLHTDNAAAEMSSSISAKAFTYGNDIFFNRGQYSPDTKDGQHLIAHELTHVAQGSGMVKRENEEEESEDEKYKQYIKESKWVREKVLYPDDEAWNKLKRNYKLKRSNKCITVVLYTSHLNACEGELSDKCAFEQSTLQYYQNRDLNGFIKTESSTNVYMIEGVANWKKSLKQLVADYGDLQNVIILGHGNYNVVELNRDNVLSTALIRTIKKLFRAADLRHGKMTHSVLLNECLTATAPFNQSEGIAAKVAREMSEGGKLDVIVMGNKASVYDGHSRYYRDGDNNLRFMNLEDRFAVSEVTTNPTPRDDRYRGWQWDGIIYDIVKRIKYYGDYRIQSSDYATNNGYERYWINCNDPSNPSTGHFGFNIHDFIAYIGSLLSSGNSESVLSFISFVYYYAYRGTSYNIYKSALDARITGFTDLYIYFKTHSLMDDVTSYIDSLGIFASPISNYEVLSSNVENIPFKK